MALFDATFAPALPRRLTLLTSLRTLLPARPAAAPPAEQAIAQANAIARRAAARADADRLLREARGPF